MILRHIKFAYRLFTKDRYYSLLNLGGLTLAIVASILMLLFIKENLTFDKHYPDYNRTYRFTQRILSTGVEFNSARSARELGSIFAEEIPGIEKWTRFRDYNQIEVTIQDGGEEATFQENSVIEADSTLFDIFPSTFLKGSIQGFKRPKQAVLTEPVAIKYFGTIDCVGKQIFPNNGIIYTVAGVIEEIPHNSHMRYDLVLNDLRPRNQVYDENDNIISEAFWNPDAFTYLQFVEGYDTDRFYELFPNIYDKYFKSFGDQIDGKVEPLLERLDLIHFYSEKEYDAPHGNIGYVYTLASIGLLIVLLACINYMMLSTSRAGKRISEIGIRKVMGNNRAEIILMILSESFLMTFVALLLSVLTTYIIIYATPFNALIGMELSFNVFQDSEIMLLLLLVLVFVGAASGLYPAYYISTFPLVDSLKGNFQDTKSIGLRKILLIVQLSISLIVITSALFMNQQMDYLRTRDLGFDKDQVVMIPIKDSVSVANAAGYMQKLKQLPYVNHTASSTIHPGFSSSELVMRIEDAEGKETQQAFMNFSVSGDYIETMGIEIIRGRNFSDENEADNGSSYLVNEQTVKTLGWDLEEAVGKQIKPFHATEWSKVIGVFRDINYSSLHNPIGPMFIMRRSFHFGNMHINVDSEYHQEFLLEAKKLWTDMPFTYPFEYEWLNQVFEEQYQEDTLQFTLIRVFSILCVFISILGLFGVASYDASRRSSEVSIRKTLGASVSSILLYFVSKYVKPMILSVVISIPLANFLVTEWLMNFEYRIEINPWYFLTPAIAISILVVLVVMQQSYRTASKNPTEELK